MSPPVGPLFEPEAPHGFSYRRDFISTDEEARLAEAIGDLSFSTFEMRGVAARRRVAFFGQSYDHRAVTPPLPEFLLPLRERVAEWAGLGADAFVMALINEYRPGSPIGWHRDAPQYDVIAGISLLSSCRMRFRPYLAPGELAASRHGRRIATHDILLERRSAYLLTGPSRDAFEHHIPSVTALRYSMTFRSARS